NAWGYYDKELTKNVRDWKEIFDVGPLEVNGPLAGATPQWPNSPAGFRSTLESYSAACEGIARHLLSAIAELMNTEANELLAAFEPEHTSYLSLNYYPVYEDPAVEEAPTRPDNGHLGVNHHSDAGALTILMQNNVAGLQVERNGKWFLVKPNPEGLVINIGDIVQVWSNDRYKAALHRALVNSEFERYSAAYFYNPSYDATYAPLPGVSGRSNPPIYSPINWGEFRARRAAGNYADYGEEIQISHFRV
ncbi:MAG: 2OG-Fe(II) oxygenase family protein, partial [Candidatus Rariloculaceae bacterium]